MINDIILSETLAFTLVQNGIWVEGGGYTFRNFGNCGWYLAYGDFPSSIRGTNKHSFPLIHTKVKWKIAVLQGNKL